MCNYIDHQFLNIALYLGKLATNFQKIIKYRGAEPTALSVRMNESISN